MESFKVSQCSISGGNITGTTSSYNTQTCSAPTTSVGPFGGPTACHLDPDSFEMRFLKYFCAASQLAQTMLVLLSAVVLVASF